MAEEPRKSIEQAVKYYDAFLDACYNRCIFTTAGGRLGIGPKAMETGDLVAALWGCQWPVVLRQRSQKEEYAVIGVSYVHGIMHGEAVEKHEATGKESTVFHLR